MYVGARDLVGIIEEGGEEGRDILTDRRCGLGREVEEGC